MNNFAKICAFCGALTLCAHSIGVNGLLETHTKEGFLGKENLLPITAAEDVSKHTHPKEYSTEIFKAEIAVEATGGTLFLGNKAFR